MAIGREFVLPGQGVVENGHFAIADHHEFLFLEGVQPGDKDMGLEAGGKLQVGHCHVGVLAQQVIAADGLDPGGKFAGQAKDHGKIVGGKRPECIFLASEFPEIEPVGIDVIDAAEFTGLDHLF